MKKVSLFIGILSGICLVIFLFVSIVLIPSETEHLIFNGVPIDGSVASFARKMEAKGLICVEEQEGKAVFAGRSEKNCVITAVASQKDHVSQVCVEFPERDVWTLLSDDYFRLKSLLTGEYGEPSECVEWFQSYEESDDSDDDYKKMLCAGQGRCKYETLFVVPEGLVKLWIESSGDSKARLMLLYLDQKNDPAEVALNDAADEL